MSGGADAAPVDLACEGSTGSCIVEHAVDDAAQVAGLVHEVTDHGGVHVVVREGEGGRRHHVAGARPRVEELRDLAGMSGVAVREHDERERTASLR
jgi:hypothetical protein